MAAKLDELTGCIIASPLGPLELKSNGSYLVSAKFSDADYANEKPNDILQLAAKQFAEYFSGKRKTFDLPIQQTGTDFQQRVWHNLHKIPFGESISYLQLAKQLGDAKTIRAAASANGKNKLAIIVPCHRVIGSNGTLTGYAGGLWRKQWLLNHELQLSGKTLQGELF